MVNESFTIWVCAMCSTEYPYQDHPPMHGGPRQRALDRRYAFLNSCWRSKTSKCKSHGLTSHKILLLSPIAPNPAQPEQDLTQIEFGPKHKEDK